MTMDKIYIKKRKRKSVERRTKSLIISDFAYDFIDRIELSDFTHKEVRMTPKQVELMANEQKLKGIV